MTVIQIADLSVLLFEQDAQELKQRKLSVTEARRESVASRHSDSSAAATLSIGTATADDNLVTSLLICFSLIFIQLI